jgi:hypothetical protein
MDASASRLWQGWRLNLAIGSKTENFRSKRRFHTMGLENINKINIL